MPNLPTIMVAPNGARKQKSDHPAIPLSHTEILECARECFAAGADGIHLHVRDGNGRHLLSGEAYDYITSQLSTEFPDHYIQVSTELAGEYEPIAQFQLLKTLKPKAASLSLAEVESYGDQGFTQDVYKFIDEAQIDVQHILYSPQELHRFIELRSLGLIHSSHPKLLFVLGRHATDQQSQPSELDPFMAVLNNADCIADWGLCAFGKQETECLIYAHSLGGKIRVGFENSFWNSNGTIAENNQERVTEILTAIR